MPRRRPDADALVANVQSLERDVLALEARIAVKPPPARSVTPTADASRVAELTGELEREQAAWRWVELALGTNDPETLVAMIRSMRAQLACFDVP